MEWNSKVALVLDKYLNVKGGLFRSYSSRSFFVSCKWKCFILFFAFQTAMQGMFWARFWSVFWWLPPPSTLWNYIHFIQRLFFRIFSNLMLMWIVNNFLFPVIGWQIYLFKCQMPILPSSNNWFKRVSCELFKNKRHVANVYDNIHI